MSDEPETMTEPISPDDTAALLRAWIAAKNMYRATHTALDHEPHESQQYAMIAVAHAVCPPGSVVVSRADLRALLEDWYAERPYWGAREQTLRDRLRAALEEQG